MNSPMTSRIQQKAAYFPEMLRLTVAKRPDAPQIDVMAAGQTRVPACNSIRYPSPSGWSVCVSFGSPDFLPSRGTPVSDRQQLADMTRARANALPFPRGTGQNRAKATQSRGHDTCGKFHSLSCRGSRQSRLRPVVTRWANKPCSAPAQALLRPSCLTVMLQPAPLSAQGQTSSIASKIRASATDLNFPARRGPATETKPPAPFGVRWLFCCQTSAGVPAGQEPEGT